MKLLVKFIIILICFFLPFPVFSGGFFFDSEKFMEDTKLRLENSPKDFLPPRTLTDQGLAALEDETVKRFMLRLYRENQLTTEEKKAKSSDIGISLSQTSGFFNLRGEPDYSSDDRKVSRILKTLPSLLDKDSQVQSLEALGKIVEPRVNLYFEF